MEKNVLISFLGGRSKTGKNKEYKTTDYKLPDNFKFNGRVIRETTFFGVSFITIGLAVGIGVMLMMAFKITHPPAGGNPIIVMIGGVSFQFLIFPVMVGAIAIIIGGIIYNRLILKRKYPQTWK